MRRHEMYAVWRILGRMRIRSRSGAGWLGGLLRLACRRVAAGQSVLMATRRRRAIGAGDGRCRCGACAASAACAGTLLGRRPGVVLRYAERLVTHDATFRALADLRVWFFRGLSRSAAGGLGFRQAGDVLARLVGDVEALDGLYLRILLPLAGAVLLLIGLIVLAHFERWPGRRSGGAAVRAGSVRATMAGRPRRADQRRPAWRRRAGGFGLPPWIPDRTARGARLRRRGPHAGAGAGREGALLAAQRELARRTALAGGGALLCGQAAILAVLIAAGANPVAAAAGVFLVVAAFETAGGLPRAGVLAGHAAAAARRVLQAAEAPAPVADPVQPGNTASAARTALRGRAFPLAAGRPPGVRRADAGGAGRRAGRAAGTIRHRANRRWRLWR